MPRYAPRSLALPRQSGRLRCPPCSPAGKRCRSCAFQRSFRFVSTLNSAASCPAAAISRITTGARRPVTGSQRSDLCAPVGHEGIRNHHKTANRGFEFGRIAHRRGDRLHGESNRRGPESKHLDGNTIRPSAVYLTTCLSSALWRANLIPVPPARVQRSAACNVYARERCVRRLSCFAKR
jgi:hypothetical protein